MANTLGAQWLKYAGAANSHSFLTILVQYLGMLSVIFLPLPVDEAGVAPPVLDATPVKFRGKEGLWQRFKAHVDSLGEVSHRGVLGVSVFEVGGNVVLAAGLFLTGSGLYMVLYSSIIVFTALGNRVFLKRTMSIRQWAAVLTISIGLSLTSIGMDKHDNHKPDEEPSNHRVALGIFVSLLGTWIHSWVYTLNDHLLSNGATASPPRAQCVWVGFYSTTLTACLILIFSVPTLIAMLPQLSSPSVALMYLFLMLCSLGHSVSYFELVGSTGGVATGVIQALRAVGVFGLSHLWYCGRDEAQCYTGWKGVATVVVVSGVMAFAWAKSLDDAAEKGMSGGKAGRGVVGGTRLYEEVALEDFHDAEDGFLEDEERGRTVA
ncbi:hypothetical protein HK101_006388 [Irineochytrium annulatum]|nr:hypothetical protein HK101_006388 [Irineochytrium annulatum]